LASAHHELFATGAVAQARLRPDAELWAEDNCPVSEFGEAMICSGVPLGDDLAAGAARAGPMSTT
jgi:hypothetical protein